MINKLIPHNIICLLLIIAMNASAQEIDYKSAREWNTPEWIRDLFGINKLNTLYAYSNHLNPFYLRGDFNGDHIADIAILIKEIKSGKIGIAICHGDSNQVFLIGAGIPFSNGGDDFKWMDVWSVYPKRQVKQGVEETVPPSLIAEALLVEKSESSSAIIYWNGKKYLWYQQGD